MRLAIHLLIRYAEHLEQVKQLHDETNRAIDKSTQDTLDQAAKKEQDEKEERLTKLLWIPALIFSFQTLDIGIGCTGTIDAKVSVRLEPFKIMATGQIVSSPYITIWNADWLLIAVPDVCFQRYTNERANPKNLCQRLDEVPRGITLK
jgi:hypothetical protein